MERYYINSLNPNIRYLRKTASILKEGGIIAYPTDTSYGIGCLLSCNDGVRSFNDLAQRNQRGLLHTMICHDFSEISKYAVMGNDVFRMMKRLMPGPYTFILQASALVPKVCQTKRRTIGVRLSEHVVVNDLLKILDAPLLNFTALSYNSERLIDDPDEIERVYRYDIDVLMDIGETSALLTTVIDYSEKVPVIVREGAGAVAF
jgi:tRNA threonylcarbamoyl adenosine modification protein (Sua5/YciO/YrdC/YwlC family)